MVRRTEECTVSETQESMIRIMCPNLACQRVLAVPADARGKQVRCRKCGTTVRIPQPKAQPSTGNGQAAGSGQAAGGPPA